MHIEHLPVPKSAPRQLERDFGQRPGVTGQGGIVLNWKTVDFEFDLGRKFFPVRVLRHRLPRGAVAALSVEEF